MKYYKDGLNLVNLKQQFRELCIEQDRWKQLLESRLEITNLETDRLTKQELISLYFQEYRINISQETVVSECKRIGLRFEKTFRKDYIKGIFVGVKIKQLEIQSK